MFAYALFVLLVAYAHGLQVSTIEGTVEGGKASDGDYYAFYGIPYAGWTTGRSRFKAPVLPSWYPGVFPATENTVICAQPTTRGLVGSENCLTVNVFTKNVTNPKPVIVWINAEEYTNTNTEVFSYRRLVENNVVFVSMNFRLSIFGFLCLNVQEAPGNAGLKDIIQGLKWVKDNIGNFGGDPKNVILMGHASGAAMVDLITLSPQSEGLVHKAIILSGSSLAPWAVSYDPIKSAQLVGDKLGYGGKARDDLAKHLVKTDINLLNTALDDFKYFNNTPQFAPCIEDPKINPNFTVLSDAPINILRSGKYPQIPVIYGYTNREGTMRAAQADYGNWLNYMQTNFTNFLQVDMDFGKNRTAVAAAIRDHYFASKAISMETIEDFLDYEGDTLVLVSVIKAAKERALTSKSEVRLLEFSYLGTMNSHWVHNQIPLSGAKHGAFLNFLFGYDLRPVDEAVSNSIVKRFVDFAYNWNNTTASAGNIVNVNLVNSTATVNSTSTNATANIAGTNVTSSAAMSNGTSIVNGTVVVNNTNNAIPVTKGNDWPPVRPNLTNYLFYGGNGAPTINNGFIYVEEARFNPHVQRMSFWDNLYAKYYVAPTLASSSSVTISCFISVVLCQLVVLLF
uniref:Carboxyl/choline esterase CCE002a n=1 Tax=Helicoverpa armigera TaxID=29058 RepID=D5G3D9_HELAM|nr:carboxyl/choline esterase CCE002a [Helicoverpa armigera]